MGSYRAKNASITELLKAHARGLLPGMLKVDQGNREAILRALNNWGWDDDLKLYLPFDETSGQSAFDLSGNGNTGTATGTTIVDGVFGKARSFNGTSDFVDIPDLDISLNISVSFWFQPSDITSNRLIITNPQGFAIGLYYSSSTLYIISTVDSQRIANVDGLVSTAASNHLAVTYDGSGVPSYYLNSVKIVNYGTANCWAAPGNYIGRRTGGTYFEGLIDEVRVYDRVLSADEIYLHYLAGALKLGLI